jgi:hypothetical protein
MQILIILLLIIIGLLFYSYQQNKEHFEPIFPLYPNYIADSYYWPTNCMETILGGIKCFPFFSYWPNYFYPYYY